MAIEDWKQIEDVSYLKERVASLEHRVAQLEALRTHLVKVIEPAMEPMVPVEGSNLSLKTQGAK